MSTPTPTPTDPREEKPEIVHGFELPSGCNATYLDHWNEFAKFYIEKIGGTADPRDSHAKMLLEFYVEGGFQEFQRLQSTASNLTAEIAGLKGMLKDWLRIGPVTGMSMAQYVVASEAQLATLRAELEAEQAKRKDTAKDFETAFRLVRQENDRLSAELESARTQRDEWFKATKLITRDRDTALAAKDAAEKRVAKMELAIHFIHKECRWEEGRGDDRIGAMIAAALTPAPTQEPPAGGQIIDVLTHTEPEGWPVREFMEQAWAEEDAEKAAGGVTISNETVGIIPTATTPTEASPDVSALGVEAASHPIPAVEKERDHWKATAQLHYNARLELERERDRKGGDSPCAPSNEPTLPDLSKCASNSPADVPSEGRGEWMPIETAPKDGTKVLALFYEECVASAKWIAHEQGGNWYLQIGESKLIEPTHWQPLPPPPMLPPEGSGT